MQKTENYGLNKPESTDFYDVEDFNSNMDVIDTKMKELESASGQSQALEQHLADTENPHAVTKSQVGLSNVPNVSTNNQTPTYTVPQEASELVSGEKLSVAMGKIAKAVSNIISHIANKSNPHSVTKEQIGILTFVDKTVAVSDWVEDTTLADYPYKASIACESVTDAYKPSVTLSFADSDSGIFSTYCDTESGVVNIYATEKPSDSIVIPNIVCIKIN